MNPKKPLLLAMLASATLVAHQARAVTYAELGDAGQTPATFQATGVDAATPLTAVSGNLSFLNDADLFAITLTSTSTFSAFASSTAGIDTSLFSSILCLSPSSPTMTRAARPCRPASPRATRS